MIDVVRKRGGLVSYMTEDGRKTPYELNMTWFSALKDDNEGKKSIRKYLCSRAVALSLEGIPGIYVQGFFGIENDLEKVSKTGLKRDINRSELNISMLIKKLEAKDSRESLVFRQLTNLIKIRIKQKAFHPAARQDILLLNDHIFSILQTSII